MAQVDLPLAELHAYRHSIRPPADLADFWQQTLAEASEHDLVPTFERVESGLVTIETYDVAFSGFGGDRIRAWLHLPASTVRGPGPLAGVVQFQGYNGGRGLCHDYTFWAGAGYAHLVVDTRGQGSGWAVGDTPDPVGAGPSQPGFLTRGVQNPRDYFYRRVYTDAVRAVEALRSHPGVDPHRICVTGGSQGGGISLAVAALTRDVMAVMPDVPFLCDFPRAVQVALTDPYTELVRYLKSHRDRVRHSRVLRRCGVGRACDGSSVVLGRPDGPDLSTVDRVRGLQRLRRTEGDRGVRIQRPRGRRRLPPRTTTHMAGRENLAAPLNSPPLRAGSRSVFGREDDGGTPAPSPSDHPHATDRLARPARR
jgi:cephalosporin-C deacetylase